MKNLKINNKKLLDLVKAWWIRIIYLVFLVCLFYLGQFLYQNFYQTVIKAKSASYDQIVKDQTANIGLWNKIKTEADEKKQIEVNTSNIQNPFK